MKFIIWLENKEKEKIEELQDIWKSTFESLGIDGLSDEDGAQQSLSKINFNSRNQEQNNVYKGKRAVSKRLENYQIFNRLKKLNDPDVLKNLENTKKWLNQKDKYNASTTVGELLKKLFGLDTFEKFINADFPKTDDTKAKPESMPPKQDTQEPNPEQQQQQIPDESQPPQPPTPGEPMSGMMGQQPQANAAQLDPTTQVPMPAKPAGAEMGLF